VHQCPCDITAFLPGAYATVVVDKLYHSEGNYYMIDYDIQQRSSLSEIVNKMHYRPEVAAIIDHLHSTVVQAAKTRSYGNIYFYKIVATRLKIVVKKRKYHE
jgi:hypothetical protein